MRKLFFGFYFLMIAFTGLGQVPKSILYSLSGSIGNEGGEAVEFCSVILQRQSDSVFVDGCISGNDGRFSFLKIPAGDYRLVFSHLNYETLSRNISVTSDLLLEETKLKKKIYRIKEVVVKSDFVKRTANSYIVDMQGNPIATGKSVMEVLPFLPGVNNIDGLKVNGLTVFAIYLNGRILPRRDELDVLRAEDIKRIQIIPVAGLSYGTSIGSIIKITTKLIAEQTYYGLVQAGYTMGLEGQSKPEINGIIHYRLKRLSFYDQMNYVYQDEYEKERNVSDFLTTNSVRTTFTSSYPNTRSFSNVLSLVYDISEKHSLGGNFTYYRTDTKPKGIAEAVTYDAENVPLNNSTYSSFAKNSRNEYYASLDYIGRLDERESSITLKGIVTNIAGNFHGGYRNGFGSTLNDLDSVVSRRNKGNNDDISFQLKADFDINIREMSRFAFGGYYNWRKSKNNDQYETENGGIWQLTRELTDTTEFSIKSFYAYSEFSTRIGKFAFNIGCGVTDYYNSQWLWGRDTMLKADFLEWIPFSTIAYYFNEGKGTLLSTVYKRAFSTPSLYALDPKIVQTSAYTYTMGNPGLKSQYTNFLQMNYVLRNKFQVSYNMTHIKNYVYSKTYTLPTDSLITYRKNVNAGKQFMHQIIFEYPIHINSWWFLKPSFSPVFYRFEDLDRKYSSRWVGLTLANSFKFKKKTGGVVSFHYISRRNIMDCFTPGYYWVDVSWYKYFFNDRLAINFNGEGVLFRNVTEQYTPSESYTYTLKDLTWETRLKFTLTYNFKGGKNKKVKVIRNEREDFESTMKDIE